MVSLQELKQLREKYDLQQAEEAHLRRLVNYCEERYTRYSCSLSMTFKCINGPFLLQV